MAYQPEFRISPYLLKLIEEAGQLRAWIDNAAVQVAWLPALQKEARAKTTKASTSIEGNPLSLQQVQAIADGQPTSALPLFELEVKNHLIALRWIASHCAERLTELSVMNLHRLLTKNILSPETSGQYKNKPNFVVDGAGRRVYTPPLPKETPKLMAQLVKWLNSSETQQLHSVIVAAILHHRLVSIHPFSDGNGRLARALAAWLLYQQGFDPHHIFSLDSFFAADRRRYYQKIEQARELDDNLTPWIEYVAEGALKTLQETKKRIEGLQIAPQLKVYLSPKQEELLRLLRDSQAVQVSEIIKALKVTRARINQLISPLIASGLVIKAGQSRATRYRLAQTKSKQ